MSRLWANFRTKGVDKVILDLRNNGGGYLSAAVNIASFFVPKGKLIVTEDYGDENKNTEYYSEGDFKRLGVVVLANEYSASASEIVTGAIKENNVGKIVGNTTFGKGYGSDLAPGKQLRRNVAYRCPV